MVEVGSIEISGALDDSDITRGFDRITNDFKEVENQANQANASFSRLSSIASNVGIGLVAIGTAGVGALTALATKSPALAGSLSTIEVNALKLGNTFGKQVKPIFDEIGQSILPSITKAISDNSDAISKIVDVGVSGLSDLANLITGNIDEIDNLAAKLALIALGGAVGGVPGAAAGGIAGQLLPSPTPEQREAYSDYGPFAESFFLADITPSIINKNTRFRDIPKAGAQFIGLSGATGVQLVIDTLQWIIGSDSKKDMEISSANGIPR